MKLFSTIIAFLFILPTSAQDSMERHYKIYDTRTQQIISIEKIVSDMASADVLFFGEEHNDSTAHYLENKILQALHAQYAGRLALSLEMFETDNQLVLDEYLEGKIDENRFSTNLRLWNNYRDYRPMIEFAKQNHISVIAANPPRRYVNLVTRRGMKSLDSLSKEAKKFLPPLPYDTIGGRYREKFFNQMKGAPESASKNIYYSQSLWDAGMAYSIYSFLKKNKGRMIFHCAGKFHSDEKLGTVAQLQSYNKKLKVLNISCLTDKNFTNPDWQQFINLGDYVIITNPELKKTF